MLFLHYSTWGATNLTQSAVVSDQFRSQNGDRPKPLPRREAKPALEVAAGARSAESVTPDILKGKARYGGVEEVPFNTEYVRRLAERDPETERHFSLYFGELLRIKLRAKLRDSGRRDDVRQETFLRVLRAIREKPACIEKPDRLGAYVNAVCNNILLEEYRASSRFQDMPPNEPEIAGDFVSPDDALEMEQRKRAVLLVLSTMPAKDQLVLRQIFFEERDKDAICQEFGVSREYLRVLLHRAKSKFREQYEKRQEASA